MRALVTGATGYVGSRLIPALLDAGFEVSAAARTPDKLASFPWSDRVERVELDVLDHASTLEALTRQPIDVAYYLVHGIGEGDYEASDRKAAQTFAVAAAQADVGRIVYLGGFVPDEALSDHLSSRAEVGEVLSEGAVDLVWLRAAVILGAGSTSFELIRHLVDRLPIIPAPEFMQNGVQPIAVDDVLHYLVGVADPQVPAGTYDIAGLEEVRYVEMVRAYARAAGLSRPLIPAGFVPPAVAARVIARLVPLPVALTEDLVGSLRNTMLSQDLRIRELVADPDGGLTTIVAAMTRSLAADERHTDDPLRVADTDPAWAGPGRQVPGPSQAPTAVRDWFSRRFRGPRQP